MDSENSAQLQYLKTLDSVQAKQQQLKTSLQSMYLDTGIETVYKSLLDYGAEIINTFSRIPQVGKLPIPAIIKLGTTFVNVSKLIKTSITGIFTEFQAKIKAISTILTNQAKINSKTLSAEAEQAALNQIADAEKVLKSKKGLFKQEVAAFRQKMKEEGVLSAMNNPGTGGQKIGQIAMGIGVGAQMLSAALPASDQVRSGVSAAGSMIGGIGSMLTGGPLGKIMGVIQIATGAMELLGAAIVTTEEKINKFNDAITEANNNKLQSEDQLKTLTEYANKWQTLNEKTNRTTEQQEEWISLNAEILSKYPELLDYIDGEGNQIADLTDKYKQLAARKRDAYAKDIIESGKEQLKAIADPDWILKQLGTSGEDLDKQYNTGTLFKNRKSTYISNIYDYFNGLGISQTALNSNGQIAAYLRTQFANNNIDLQHRVSNPLRTRTGVGQGTTISLQEILSTLENNSQGQFWVTNVVSPVRQAMNYFLKQTGQTIEDALSNSGIETEVTTTMKSLKTYQTDYANKVIKSNVAALRQGYESILDPDDRRTGFAGLLLNDQLLESYEQFKTKKENLGKTEEQNWEAWSKSALKTYSDINQMIDNAALGIENLSNYYDNLATLSQAQVNTIQTVAAGALKVAKENRTIIQSAAILLYQEYQKLNNKVNADLAALANKFNFDAETLSSLNIANRRSIVNIGNKEGMTSSMMSGLTDFASGKTDEQLSPYLSILQSGTVDSLIGIQGIISAYAQSQNKSVSELDGDQFVQLLKSFENSIQINFNTEYQTLTESYTKNLKEFDKALKNATQGMGFEDAVAMAAQLGKNLGDFRFTAGKFYYDSLEDIKSALVASQQELKKTLDSATSTAATKLFANENALFNQINKASSIDDGSLSEDGKKLYAAVQGFKNSSFYTEEGTLEERWQKYIDSLQTNINELDKATQYVIAQHYLSIGDIQHFITSINEIEGQKKIENKEALYKAALEGTLEGYYAQFQDDILKFFQDGIENVYKGAEKVLKGEVQGAAITVTQGNAKLLETLTGISVEFNPEDPTQTVVLTAQQIEEHWDAWLEYLAADGKYTADQLSDMQKLYKARFSTNIFDSLKTAITSYKGFEFSTWGDLPDTIKTLATFDQKIGKWVLDIKALSQLTDIQLMGMGYTPDQVRQIRAQIEKTAKAESNDTIIQTITKNHKSLNEENITQISKLLNISYDAAKKYLIDNGDGTWSIDLNTLQTLIKAGGIEISGATQTFIENTVLSEIEQATKYINSMSTGYTSSADMQKIMDIINEGKQLGDEGYLNFDAIFEYNTALHAWKLSSDGMNAYLEKINKQISNATSEQQKKGLTDQKLKTLLDNNDLDTFLLQSGAIYTPYRDALKQAILKGDWNNLPQEYKKWIDEFMNLRKDTEGQIINGLNNAASSFTKQTIIKKDQVDTTVMDSYMNNYGDIITKTADGDYMINLAKTTLEQASDLIYEICINQGQTVQEATDQARQYVESNAHDKAKSALNVLKQLASNAGGMDKTTADNLQAYYERYGGSGQLTEWNQTLQSYVFVGKALQNFITLLNSKGIDNNEAVKAFEDINKTLISSGQIDTFLSNVGSNRAQLYAFMNGGIITDALLPYYEQLSEYLSQGTQEVLDGAIKLLKGETNQVAIKVTEGNRRLINKVFDAQVKNGDTALISRQLMQSKVGQYIDEINNDATKTIEQKQKEIADLWSAYYNKVSPYDAIKAVLDSPDSFDITAYQNLSDDFKKLVSINTETGKFSIALNQITDQMLQNSNLSTKQINEFKAKIESQTRKQSAATVINEIVKNRQALTEENITSLANLLNKDYDEVIDQLKLNKNDNGTYSINLSELRQLINQKNLELNNQIQQMIGEIIQNAIDAVKTVFTNQENGYTNYSDMQKIVNSIQQFGFNYSFDELFTFNDQLGAYFATTKNLFAQLAIAQSQLEGATQEERKVAQTLINDIGRQLREKIDFSVFISASFVDDKTQDVFNKAIQDYNDYLEVTGETTRYNAQKISDYILKGGAEGVAAAQQMAKITGKTLSGDDLVTIYKKQSNALVTAMGELSAKTGTIVGDAAAKLITLSGGKVEQLADGSNLVVQSAVNLTQAYSKLYYQLYGSGTATIEELNNAAAKIYENKYQSDLMSMMTNLTDMTFSSLANIYTAAGKMLSPGAIQQMLNSGAIQSLGAGKLRISSFENFAKFMNINPDSQEYRKAFSTFNDQMIRINTQVSDNIKNAADNILAAHEGSQINLTEIYTRLDAESLAALTNNLAELGADLSQGILTINNEQNIEKIYEQIIKISNTVGELTAADLVEIQKKLLKRRRERNLDSIVSDIVSNADKLTEDNIEQLAIALGKDFDEVLKYFAYGQNGYFKIDETHLRNILGDQIYQLNKTTRQLIENMSLTQFTEAETLLENLSGQITGGFSNLGDMQSFVDELNKKGHFNKGNYTTSFTIDALFKFDETLNTWILTREGIIAQIQMIESQMQQSGVKEETRKQTLTALQSELARNIDILSYAQSEDKTLAYDQLKRSIDNYNASVQALGSGTAISIDKLTAAINLGGTVGVEALEQFAKITGQKFSAEDYTTVFLTRANNFTKAVSELTTSVGGIISETTVKTLGLTGRVQQIGNTGKYLVTQTINLVSAYQQLYNRLTHTAGVTLQDINNFAVQLNNKQFGNKQSILSNISSDILDYSTLANMATELGMNVQDLVRHAISEGSIARTASGNIKILDFDGFITELGISKEVNGQLTQAYKTAYKAWNDSLIENITKDANNIKSELDSLVNAKAGDYVNISSILSGLASDRRAFVEQALRDTGAQINNGIIFITEKAQENIVSIIRGIAGETGVYATKKGNQLMASAYKQEWDSSIDSLYLTILQSRESLTEDNILAIADAFGYTYDSVASWLESAKQGNGTYKLSAADVEELFKDKDISSKTKEYAKKLLGSINDNIISSLSGISNKTFSLQQMSTLVSDLKTKTGKEYNQDDLFKFNEELGGYVLTTQGIYTKFRVAALEIGENKEGQKLLEQQAEAFLSDINLTDVVSKLQGNVHDRHDANSKVTAAIQKYNAAMTALGKPGLNPIVLLDNLAKGGIEAVQAAQAITRAQGQQLSDADAKSIYRSRVEQLMQAAQELMSTSIGGVISDTTADLLGYSNAGAARLTASGSTVLQTAENLVEAYTKLYDKLIESGAATLSELNQIMARELGAEFEAANGSNKGVEYLSKAASMTYEDFGQIFAQAGVSLAEHFSELVEQGIISEIGGGLIRVENFAAIAQRLGIEQNSQEYTKAFKAYNDSLIQLDTTVKDNILAEVKSVANAKSGKASKINLTQLYMQLDEDARLALQSRLMFYGGYLKNGILNIQANANIPGLIQRLTSFAQEHNLLLEDEIAELADTLSEIIQGFANSISKGLSGTLNNSEANNLKAQAKNWFDIDINFMQTNKGLQMSVDKATELYFKLKQVDGVAANLVFEELSSSLTKANDTLSTASDIAAEIKNIETKLEDSINANNDALKNRLQLYKEIQIAQMDSAESYDFMGQSLPAGMQGVENYWNSIGKAFKLLNQASENATKELNKGEIRKDSTIGLQDYYNMINEFNNLAKLSGTTVNFLGMELTGNMEDAAKAIQKGFSAITNIDGEGAAVNLNKLGANFLGGAEGMAKGVDAGIKAMAESQIKMLDGLIQLLETVVAMEELEGLDTDKSGTFEFQEMFKWNEQMQAWEVMGNGAEQASKIIEQANKEGFEDLKKGLQQVKINGVSIYDMLQDMSDGAVKNEQQARLYNAALSALFQQFKTGDYDLNNLGKSVLQIAKNSQEMMTLNLGDQKVLVGRGVQFEWDEEHQEWKDEEGNLLGNNEKTAYQKYQANVNKQILDSILQGKAVDGEITLKDNRKVKVTGGVALLPDENNLIWVGKKAFHSYEQAVAYINTNPLALFNIQQNLQSAQIFKNGEKTYQTVAGFTWEVHLGQDGQIIQWIGTNGQKYKSAQAAYKASLLELNLSKLGEIVNISINSIIELYPELEPNRETIRNVDISATDGGKDAQATIHAGVPITVQIDGDHLSYKVEGDETTYTSYNEAVRAAINKSFELFNNKNKGSFQVAAATPGGEFSAKLISGGFIVEVKDESGTVTGYKVNGKEYKTWNEATGALANMLYNSDGTFKYQNDPSGYSQFQRGFIQIPMNIKIKNQTGIADLKVQEQQEIAKVLATGNKTDIENAVKQYIDIEWSSDGDIASAKQLKEIAEVLGIQWEDKILNLSAIFADDPASKAAESLFNSEEPPEATVKLTVIGATAKDQAILDAMAENNVTATSENDQTPPNSTQLNSSNSNVQQLQQKNAWQQFLQQISQGALTLAEQLSIALNLGSDQEQQSTSGTPSTGSNPQPEHTLGAGPHDYEQPQTNTEAVDENTQKIQALQEQIAELQTINQQLQQQNEQQNARIEELNTTLGQLQQQIADLAEVLPDEEEQQSSTALGDNTAATKELTNALTVEQQSEVPSTETQAPSWGGITSENAEDRFIAQLLQLAVNNLLAQQENNNNVDEELVNLNSKLGQYLSSNNTEQISNAVTTLLAYLQEHYPDSSNETNNSKGITSNTSDVLQDTSDALKVVSDTAQGTTTIIMQQSTAQSQLQTALQNTDTTIDNTKNKLQILKTVFDNMANSAAKGQAGISKLVNAINRIPSHTTIGIDVQVTVSANSDSGEVSEVKGNVNGQPFNANNPSPITISIAKAKGNQAYASGQTLMGQLGPELVVSKGHYFVVGQNGAQMVDLDPDAIVFNHLQTKKLLKNNHIASRGKPVTNERRATAFASGTGPAKASASAALATLKQIRAMWQSMLSASMQELGSLAGREASSGANGGSGGSGSGNNQQLRTTTAEIQRWYNLLRQIASFERDITYQNTLQNKLISDRVANGQALYKSYKQQLQYLDEIIVRNQQLAQLQHSWYDRKVEELRKSDYGKIFTYDENGMLQYVDGLDRGLDVLEKLTQRGIYGESTGAAASAKSQIEYLKSIGFDVENLKYNSDGTIIRAEDEKYDENPDEMYQDMMNNFWENLDGWRSELDGLYDSYRDQLNSVLDNENKRNQILQKIVDNQISVQNDILKAIESREQKIIDELQKQRDALEKSSKQFIDGLSDQLKEQRQMYQNQENDKQLTKLRRQVAILQRSGGSSSQIRTLQQQIAAKQQNLYFSQRQQQIAAIQKASDLQIQRLDSQIALMTETLKYQKQNGLLWNEVYQIMASTPEQIRQFITQNTPDFQSASALDVAQKIRDIDLRINEWIAYRDDETQPDLSGNNFYDWQSYRTARSGIFGDDWGEQITQQARAAFDRVFSETGDINQAGAAADAILAAVIPMLATHTTEDSDDSTTESGSSSSGSASTESGSSSGTASHLTRPAGLTDEQWAAIVALMQRSSSGESHTYTAEQLAAIQIGRQATDFQGALIRQMYQAQAEIAKNNNADLYKKIYKRDFQMLSPINQQAMKKKFPGFKTGGLVNYTGLAQVDGTPSRPEAFLNAEQTKMLSDFLTTGVDTLAFALDNLQHNIHNNPYISNTNKVEENGEVIIEQVDVNINVDKIADNYDVKNIGTTVMEEMLKIARKSGNRSLSRR